MDSCQEVMLEEVRDDPFTGASVNNGIAAVVVGTGKASPAHSSRQENII